MGKRPFFVQVATLIVVLMLLNCSGEDDGAFPTITLITTPRGPAEGAVQGGTPVFIRGTNFGSDTVVFFGDKPSLSTIVQSSSFIIAEAGPVFLSGPVSVTVTTGGQIAVLPQGFRYTPLVAFSSDRTGNFEVFTMSIGGFDIKQVTNNALGQQGQQPPEDEINESPFFSPDGKDIVYTSNKSGDIDIFIAGRTGTNPTDLSNNDAANDVDPAFSSDGNFIVFSSNLNSPTFQNLDGDFEIFRMNRDGSNLTRLTFNSVDDRRPSYSPDGSRIVYDSEQNSGETDLFVMNSLDGGNVVQLTSGSDVDFDPVFTPDGSQIVFARDRNLLKELWVVSSDGTGFPIQLTFAQADTENPAFVPDLNGEVTLLFQKDAEAKEEIHKIECRGTATRFIFTCDEKTSINISQHVNSDRSPVASP